MSCRPGRVAFGIPPTRPPVAAPPAGPSLRAGAVARPGRPTDPEGNVRYDPAPATPRATAAGERYPTVAGVGKQNNPPTSRPVEGLDLSHRRNHPVGTGTLAGFALTKQHPGSMCALGCFCKRETLAVAFG